MHSRGLDPPLQVVLFVKSLTTITDQRLQSHHLLNCHIIVSSMITDLRLVILEFSFGDLTTNDLSSEPSSRRSMFIHLHRFTENVPANILYKFKF